MNVPSVPAPPQYHTMYDGSKAINQSEQVSFNTQVSTAIQHCNNNFINMEGQILDLKTEVKRQSLIHDHFKQFVNTLHPEILEQYIETLLVQQRLEQANDGSNV